MSFEQGKITGVMGPSGTGKTTLLKLIGGQLKPDEGTIFYQDQNIHALPQKALYQLRKSIGLLFQNSALFTNITTYENVAFPLREHTQLSEAFIKDLVLMKLEAVGLRGAQALMPSELSGGMARRAALARALAMDPTLMMYDEPFAGQDPISMGVIMKLIRILNQTLKMTTILVSHDVKEVFELADDVYILSDGKIIGHGRPDQLQQDKSPLVQQFIQGLPDGAVPFHFPAPSLTEDFLIA
jgi:phospholipid/cholesterol/gamma-HCH transport system ATP-binding protein